MTVRLVPVFDKNGEVIVFDIYVNDRWMGSRRTEAQAREQLGMEKTAPKKSPTKTE